MTTGGEPAVIEVDYGKDIDGIPFFVVRSESDRPSCAPPTAKAGSTSASGRRHTK